jgi:hypothetical protein
MATIQLDPVALQARYDQLMAEAERIKRVLDLVPDLQRLSGNGRAQDRKSTNNGLRPIASDLMAAIKAFIEAFDEERFLIPNVLDWLKSHKRGFDVERDRDAVVAGLRHFCAEDGPLMVLVPGVGRRPQVYGYRDRLPKSIGGNKM